MNFRRKFNFRNGINGSVYCICGHDEFAGKNKLTKSASHDSHPVFVISPRLIHFLPADSSFLSASAYIHYRLCHSENLLISSEISEIT